MSSGLDAPPSIPDLAPRRKRRKPRYGWRRALFSGIAWGVALLLGSAAGLATRAFYPPARLGLEPVLPAQMNVLFLGLDNAAKDKGGKPQVAADTILVAQLEPAARRAYVLSIPRDVRVAVGENGRGKLGAVYADGGMKQIQEAVEALTMVSLGHMVKFDMGRAREVLGMLGKPRVYVDRALHYEDKAGGTVIDFRPGWHELDPAAALAFARFREGKQGEGKRLDRQQQMLMALHEGLRRPSTWWWLPGAVRAAAPLMETDLKAPELQAMAEALRAIPPERVRYAQLPGHLTPEGEWIVNPQRTETLMARLAAPEGSEPDPEPKLVELLHDEKQTAQALDLAEKLTKQGFQVIRTAREPEGFPETRVLDRSKPPEANAAPRSHEPERRLLGLLGGGRLVVTGEPVTAYGATYTVQLGHTHFDK